MRALTHALQNGRLHHAYLFTGTRGVGKTTIARILAKSLNCENGVSASPCGVCGTCQEIDAGRFVDLLEVDAATNTRVDEMRQLLENAVYAPTRGRYKVYVIDEVHMLSNAAFNAMLKTLEEPPEHVKFILATTDPQKIPVTVLSRCLQFNLKQMSLSAIVAHLSKVLGEEGISAEETALRLLAGAASGSMRDALSLLDQAIAYGAGAVKGDEVSVMLGTFGNEHLHEIVDALISSDPISLKRIAEDIANRSLSFDAALASLAELWVEIQAAQFGCFAGPDGDLLDIRIQSFAAQLGAEYVQLAYSITLQGRSQLSLAPDPESGFLMTLLRLHAFYSADNSGQEKKNNTVDLRSQFNEEKPTVLQSSRNNFAANEVPPPIAADLRASPLVSADSIVDNWIAILGDLKLAGLARELASHCELMGKTSHVISLRISQVHRHLLSKSSQDKLQGALIDRFGVNSVDIAVGETESETPAQIDSRQKSAALDRAMAAIESDTVVRELIEIFDAGLIESSVRPLQSQF